MSFLSHPPRISGKVSKKTMLICIQLEFFPCLSSVNLFLKLFEQPDALLLPLLQIRCQFGVAHVLQTDKFFRNCS